MKLRSRIVSKSEMTLDSVPRVVLHWVQQLIFFARQIPPVLPPLRCMIPPAYLYFIHIMPRVPCVGLGRTVYFMINPLNRTVIDCHLKQLTRCLSSNHNNNKILDRKDGRPSITLLHVARSFFQIKMLTTERGLSVEILLIYRTCHHLKQTKCGISQHSNLCHRSSPLSPCYSSSSIACTVIWCAIVTFLLAVTVTTNP